MHEDYKVTTISEELCKQSLTKMEFLNYKPSLIAAAALTLAITLANTDSSERLQPNIECWNEDL